MNNRRLWAQILWRIAVFPTILALLSCGIALADDGSVSGEGGSVSLMTGSHPSVHMISEVVKIDHLPDGHVTAKFVFKNNGPACTVKIGFPGNGAGDGGTPDLTAFKSWVDGKPVAVRRLAGEQSADEEESSIWYVKTVRFGAGQTHVITDTYASGGGFMAGPDESFSYTLDTGSSWHGSIGSGKIIVDASGLRMYGFPNLSPEGRFVRKGKIAEWDFANLKPIDDDDINIDWPPCFTDVILNGKRIASGGLPDWDVAGDERALFSQRRGIELWLPADVAAEWLGAKMTMLAKANYRITLGDRWVDFRTWSDELIPSVGRKVILPYPVDIETVPRDPLAANIVGTPSNGGHHMIGLIGLIRALGGDAHFDADGVSLIATLPK